MESTGKESPRLNQAYSCAVLSLEEGAARAARPHQAGDHRGHEDPVPGQLVVQSFREARQGELAGAVRQQVGCAELAADRRDVDDPAGTPPPHLRQDRQRRVERPPEVGLHRVLVILQGRDVERPDLDDPRVVDQDVDAIEAIEHQANHPLDLAPVRHIAGDGDHLGTEAGEVASARSSSSASRAQRASLTPCRASSRAITRPSPREPPVISAVRPRRGISLRADHLAGGEQGAGRRRHPEELPAGVPIHHSPPRRLRPRAAAPGSWVSSRFPILGNANPLPETRLGRLAMRGPPPRHVTHSRRSRPRDPRSRPDHRHARSRTAARDAAPGDAAQWNESCIHSMSARAGLGSVLLEGNGRAFTGRRCIR